MKKSFHPLLGALVVTAIVFTPSRSYAASGTWSTGTSGDWGTAGNWNSSIIADGAGETADVGFTSGGTITLAGVNQTIGILDLSSTTGAANLAATGGAFLVMDNNSSQAQINVTASTATTGAFTAPLVMTTGGLKITSASGSGLVNISNVSSGATSGIQVLETELAGSGNLHFLKNVTDGGSGGIVAVVTNQNFTGLVDSGNTFSGGLTLKAGIVRSDIAGIGTGTLTLGAAGGGAVTLAPRSGTYTNTIVVAAAGASTAKIETNVTNTDAVFSGSMTLDRDVTISPAFASTITLSGNISGTGELKMGNNGTGGNVLTLSGSNTFTGRFVVDTGAASGQLNLGSAAATGNGIFRFALTTTTHPAALKLDNSSGGALTLTKNNVIEFNNFTFLGTDDLNLGTGAASMVSTAGAQITVTQKKLTMGGVLSGGVGQTFTKAGAGALQFDGANTYTGATSITAGTLIINGNSSAATGAVTVDAGAVLSGTGTIGGATTVSGTLAPGNSPGNLTIANNVSLLNDSALSMEITGATVGSQYDRLTVTGASLISLTDTNDIVLSLTYTPAANALFFLVDNQGGSAISGIFEKLNGTITDLSQGALFSVGAQAFNISYTGDLGTNAFLGGNDLVIQAVPEPGTVAMLMGAAGMFLLLKPRRRQG